MSPWIRLDDDYIYHPKFKALSHLAFRLWHEGMAYSRKLQTDGAIPSGALKGFNYAQKSAITELTTAIHEGSSVLWEVTEGGYAVHDYLQWNASKEVEVTRREANRERLKKHRVKRVSDGVAHIVSNAFGTRSDGTEQDQVRGFKDQKKTSIEPSARSKRPIFTGQRVTIFEWMLDDCLKLLGNHVDTFDLDQWFWDLDAKLVKDGLTAPRRDGGAWLQSELLAECARRKIPIKVATWIEPQASSLPSSEDLAKRTLERLARERAAGGRAS